MSDGQQKPQRQPRAFSVPEDSIEQASPKKVTVKATKTKSAKSRKSTVPPVSSLDYDATDEDFFAAQDRGELEHVAPPPTNRRQNRKLRLGALAFAALSFLLSAAFGLWLQELVTQLFAENSWLGWIAVAATAALTLAIVVFVIREIASIWKLRSTADLRSKFETALKSNNSNNINILTRQLESHFQDQPKTAHGRATLEQNRNEVMDAQDRYALAERELLSGLDAEARKIVSNAAKRVSVVTAVSPRAIIDVGYVLYENVRLIRVLCELYGGRAGFVGTMALTRRVVTHLAVTGTTAVGEGVIQQLLGLGLAAKLSARLGEGVVNGVMTARIGLAAIDVCRPAPFHALERPRLSNFISMLTKLGGDKKTATNNQE